MERICKRCRYWVNDDDGNKSSTASFKQFQKDSNPSDMAGQSQMSSSSFLGIYGYGWCHFNPPITIPNDERPADSFGVFPKVAGNQWCGQWFVKEG